MGAEPIHVMSNLVFRCYSLVLWYIGNEGFFHINVNVCLEGFIKQITNHLLDENRIYFWIKQTEILHKKYPCFDVSKNISSFSKECNISFDRALVFSLKKMFHLPKATTCTKIFLFKEKVEKRVAKISYGFTQHCFKRDKLVCWKTCSITITMETEAHKQLFVSGFATTKWVIARLRTSF